MAQAYKTSDIEILVSTMDRDDLDFLMPMFPFAHFSGYNLLIINQTTQGAILQSAYPTVRVINSFERGLSKSRNLALQNTTGKIAVVTDDDVVFKEGFDKKVIKGFNTFPKAAAIKFCAETFEGKLFRKYLNHPEKKMNALQRLDTMSIEMALNISLVRQSGIQFNTLFGLGSVFEMGEEPVFVHELFDANYQTSFMPEVIVSHKALKDSDNIPINELYRIKGAYLQKIFKNKFIFWLGIQLMYHVKNRTIAPAQIAYCIKNAMLGRRQFLTLSKK